MCNKPILIVLGDEYLTTFGKENRKTWYYDILFLLLNYSIATYFYSYGKKTFSIKLYSEFQLRYRFEFCMLMIKILRQIIYKYPFLQSLASFFKYFLAGKVLLSAYVLVALNHSLGNGRLITIVLKDSK